MVREKVKGTRITVDLGSEGLYRALHVLAAEQGRKLRDVVSEALRQWIEWQEEQEDIAAFKAAEDEPERSLDEARREWGLDERSVRSEPQEIRRASGRKIRAKSTAAN